MSSKSQQQSNRCGCLLDLIIFGLLPFGLLAAISLPSFFNVIKKPKHSEAKTYVGSMNRAQQAYFLDNKTFSNDMAKLGLGIKTETENYSYSTRATNKAVFNYGISKNKMIQSYVGGVFLVPATEVNANAAKDEMTTVDILKDDLSIPRRITQPLNSYIGGVFLVPATEVDANAAKDEMTTIAILCETKSPTTTKPAQPTYKNGVITCPEGTRDLSK